MKTKIGMLFALTAVVLSLVAPTEKKAIIKTIISTSAILNSR